MTTPDATGGRVASLESTTSQLSSSLSRLQNTVEGLEQGLEEAQRGLSNLADVPTEIDRLQADLRDAKDDLEDAEQEIAATSREVSRLAIRIEALERHRRRTSGDTEADFFDSSGDLHHLGQTADRGHTAQQSLLTEAQRSFQEQRINTLRVAKQNRDQLRDRVIEAAQILATTAPGTAERSNAQDIFTTTVPKAKQAAAGIPTLEQAAAGARRTLAADDTARGHQAKTITAGQRAENKLRMILRGKLTEALAAAELLPLWFTTALGPLPPPNRAEEWMQTAVDVLTYRVTYRVTDSAVALGSTPSADTGWRITWHRQLQKAIAGHNR